MPKQIEVVSSTRMRIVAGAEIAVLEPNTPRRLPPTLAAAAVAMGATELVPDEVPAPLHHDPVPEAPPPVVKEKPKTKRRKRARSKKTILADTITAIRSLEPVHFTTTGEPRLSALTNMVPDVTADIRDEAWAEVVEQSRTS